MPDSSSPATGRDKSGIIVGLVLFALAGVLWFDAIRLSGAVNYGVGPAVFPKLIAGGLVLLGLLSIISGMRSAAPELESADPIPILMVIGGFLALTVLIGIGGGFIPAMVVLFVTTSTAFGRRAYLVDAGIGFVVASCTYLLFSKVLLLSLPQGPLEMLFG